MIAIPMDGLRPPAEIVRAAAARAAEDLIPVLAVLPEFFTATIGFEVGGKTGSRFALRLQRGGIVFEPGERRDVLLHFGFTDSGFRTAAGLTAQWWGGRPGRAVLRKARRDPETWARRLAETADEIRMMMGKIGLEVRDGRSRKRVEVRLGESGSDEPWLRIEVSRDDLLALLDGELDAGAALDQRRVRLSGDPSVLLAVAPFLF